MINKLGLEILSPLALSPGDTLGVFTPSSPGYVDCPGLFENGLKNIEALGFKVKLGDLAKRRSSQIYRSASAQDRAQELMELICDPTVRGVISTIGGSNSSSLIPFLDFSEIRKQRKVLCGYSDVTSLHLAFLHFAGLQTVYSPAVMCWFGDWPNGCSLSQQYFLQAITSWNTKYSLQKPERWSNHRRRWDNDDWKNIPRQWQSNINGWKVLQNGVTKAPVLALNLNTLMSACGTEYWPDFSGKILLIEDMDCGFGRTERALRQLSFIGVFDKISGLIIGKPEVLNQSDAPFSYLDLVQEIVGPRSYPILGDFDCGHTLPMISFPQMRILNMDVQQSQVSLFFDGP
ncbi:MAG: LD-carboxypeptidase [Proteobacteria bacterium]|nr:LD-carboxypeptidase [Pseudomonadota bacterium]